MNKEFYDKYAKELECATCAGIKLCIERERPLNPNCATTYYKDKVADLEAKLAEQQECSLKASAKHSLEMQNAQMCVKELEVKLAEKDKEFKWLHQKFAKYAESNQDKISFALEQLEKVKELCRKDMTICEDYFAIAKILDNQIAELTHQHEDKGE